MGNGVSGKELIKFQRNVTKTYFETDDEGKKKLIAKIENQKQQGNLQPLYAISLLFHLTKDRSYLIECLRIIENSEMSLALKHFYFTQTRRAHFINSLCENFHFSLQRFQTFISLLDEIKNTLSRDWDPITPQQRNRNKIVFLRKLVLRKRHGPTGDTFDIIQALTEKLGYEVTLINTCEPISTETGFWCNATKFSKIEEFNGGSTISLENGTTIKFYQNPHGMVNLNEIEKMLDLIYNENPRFVFCLGSPNIIADLASAFTTVLNMPNGAILPLSTGGNLLVPRELKNEDRELLDAFNMTHTTLHSVQYIFRIPELCEDTPAQNRADLGIPGEAEVFGIIGTRLNNEITQESCLILEQVIQERQNSFFVFIGPFEHYSDRMKHFPLLSKHSIALGYRYDVRELLQLCDYYLNPPRQGGGISAVCALTHGIPVFTQPSGDVAQLACREGYYIPWHTAHDIVNYLQAIDSGYQIPALDPEVLKQRAAAITDRERQVTEFCEIAEDAIERQWGKTL